MQWGKMMLQQLQEEILRFGNSLAAQLWNKSLTFQTLRPEGPPGKDERLSFE